LGILKLIQGKSASVLAAHGINHQEYRMISTVSTVSPLALDFSNRIASELPALSAFQVSVVNPGLTTQLPSSAAANVLINEWAQGGSGLQEWVELLTTTTTDLRGWQLTDETVNQLGQVNVTFSSSDFWQSVPAGTLIVIYNGSDRDPFLPANDFDWNDGNGRIIAPHSDTNLFSPRRWGGISNTILTDNPMLRDANGAILHDWDQNNDPTFIARSTRPGTQEATAYLGNTIAGVMSADNYALLDLKSATPGDPNSQANMAWIESLRNQDLPMPMNEPPSGIRLDNVTFVLPETSDTANRIELADVVVIDDALGSNRLSLTGPDAARFELSGNALYLTAGTALDYETQPNYSVNIQVVDPTLNAPEPIAISFSLALTNVNEAPILSPIAAQRINQGERLTFQAKAIDPDGATRLTYSLVQAPAGASMNSSTGEVSWIPEQVGLYSLTLKVSDGEKEDLQSVAVDVRNAPLGRPLRHVRG
jgi:hypothetical protein